MKNKALKITITDGDDGSSPGTFRKVSRRRSIVAVALFARVFGDDVSSPSYFPSWLYDIKENALKCAENDLSQHNQLTTVISIN
ncbi:hypothetical protein J6590_093502 [Homalodisca vitripennis]|nr:hypothetical protein J6590_093502 [Homalodisca vitripennis]